MRILSLLLLAFVFVGYQNCAEQKFTEANLDKVSIDEGSDLVPIEDDTNEDDVVEDPIVEDPVDDVDDDDVSSNKKDFICILEGHGKSVRLGFIQDKLDLNGSTPKTVCTTERGCLEIASQKFDVVSAERRGFCKNDKAQSVALSEEDLEQLVK